MEVIHNERISKKPLYVQVYDILAHRISRGILPDGTYLANEYDLSREMNVSIGTIRKAVDLLTEAQLVIRQQGKGTLVSDRRWLAIREKLNRIRFGEDAAIAAWSSERLSYEKQPAGEQLAAILQIEPADEVHRLNNLWTAHPKAVADVVSYIPIAVISDFPANDENIQTTTGIAMVAGIEIGRVEERVSAVPASETMARTLSTGAGAPLLKKVRLTHSHLGTPIEYRVGYYATDEGFYWSSST